MKEGVDFIIEGRDPDPKNPPSNTEIVHAFVQGKVLFRVLGPNGPEWKILIGEIMEQNGCKDEDTPFALAQLNAMTKVLTANLEEMINGDCLISRGGAGFKKPKDKVVLLCTYFSDKPLSYLEKAHKVLELEKYFLWCVDINIEKISPGSTTWIVYLDETAYKKKTLGNEEGIGKDWEILPQL